MKVEDIKAYIESGILELYVLGDVTPQEKAEVEALAAKHPAIKAELEEIEKSLELYAKANEIEPDENQRDRILNSLVVNLGDDRNFNSRQEARPEAKIISLERARPNKSLIYAFAACFALLIANMIALVNVYERLQDSKNLIASLQSQNQQIARTTSLMDNELKIYQDPSFKMVKLSGTAKSPSSKLMVAFSPSKKKVMIDMSNADMPVNDKDHQYQLWALVGGKPVDLGVFDADTTSKGMKEMKEIASADAFAVTLEKRGGSPTPTLDEMMVLGKF